MTERTAYEIPAIADIGTVQELTLAGASGAFFDFPQPGSDFTQTSVETA